VAEQYRGTYIHELGVTKTCLEISQTIVRQYFISTSGNTHTWNVYTEEREGKSSFNLSG